MKKYLKISLLSILFILVVSIGCYGIYKTYYTSSQVELFLKINSLLSFWEGWLNITALGDALLLFPLFSFLILKNTRAWAALFGAIPLSMILSHAGKSFFAIPRPASIIDNDKFTIIGNVLSGTTSLPSGHTITIFAVISAILYTSIHGDKKIKHLAVWGIGLIFLGFVVAISRVAVGAHWPVDILLGAIFGFFGGLSGAALTFKYQAWWHWMTVPKYRYVHVFILLVLSIAMILEYSQLAVAWLSVIVTSLVMIKLLILKGYNESY